MLNKVLFVSRTAAENLAGDWSNWAIISIIDPTTSKVKFSQNFKSELHLSFHDSYPSVSDEKYMVHPNENDAYRIVEFVNRVAPEIEGIIIHCGGGVSRSAAVAKWIASQHKLSFNEHYRQYNKHIYNLLIETSKSWQRSHS